MIKVKKQGFPGILKDNDKYYLDFITDAMSHADPEAELLLNKIGSEIKVVVFPSGNEFRQDLINNLLAVHNLVKIKIVFSKSLAISKSIAYSVEM